MTSTAVPLSSRWKDIAYLVFFLIHVPIIFVVDIGPLYPVWLKPSFIAHIQAFYYETYADRFFSASYPAWFDVYRCMELFYHVPVSLWSIGALVRDDRRVPLVLLPFAVQTALTTATCIAEYLSWQELDVQQKIALGQLYVPYCILAVLMTLDMYTRLSAALTATGEQSATLKKTQ